MGGTRLGSYSGSCRSWAMLMQTKDCRVCTFRRCAVRGGPHMGADQTFQQDCIELLKEQTAGRPVNRRHFLAVLAALGVSPLVCRLSPAHAQAKEIVVVNWGGDAVAGVKKVWAESFNARGGKRDEVVGACLSVDK